MLSRALPRPALLRFETCLVAPVSRFFATAKMINPQTGEVFREVTLHEKEDVDKMITIADNAFQQWRRIPGKERISKLSVLAEKLRERAEDAAVLMNQEMGKPVSQGKGEVLKCAYLVDWYAQHGPAMLEDQEHPPLPGFKRSFVTYRPLGVIVSIMPWNFPFWQVIRMAVPTIMAGNTVILKHATNCFPSSIMIEEIFNEVPDIPRVFQSALVGSPMVKGMLENPAVRGVALTGSEGAGKAVATHAGSLLKKAVVELGGSDAYCILADADLDVAANAVVNGRLLNTGQVCISPKRVIVDKSIKSDFEKLVLQKLEQKTYGTDFGPMASEGAKVEVAGMVQATLDKGAKLLAGGAGQAAPEQDSGKAYFAPTVLTDVKPGMCAFDEEIFGPVIAITEASSEEHAIELANQSEFGLGGAVFTKDLEKGERIASDDIEAGMVFVNDFVRSDPSLPFGGVKSSGLGRECSVFGMREFANVKTICIK